ncbi:MAG: hypothetical protein NT169_26885 [Chloroflexi bacterium]|nr:hypothetical protein [Chloroflexota bacterium]
MFLTTLSPPVKPSGGLAGHDLVASDEGFEERARPISLHEVSEWAESWQRMLFRVLLPIPILVQFGIHPIKLTDRQGRRVAHLIVGKEDSGIRVEVYPSAEATDTLMEIELRDTPFNQIEVVWVAVQDPRSPRFDIDVMPDGDVTLRGTAQRNLAAETAALAAGLAPGQIRKGIGQFGHLMDHLETFMLALNRSEYVAQPLFYHTAILFERVGFSYIQGQARMEQVAAGFAPGGDLRARLDGSSPFRRPELADTISGRAWAIHDGILDEGWDRVKMVKRLGMHVGVDTCPGVPW